MPHKKGLEWNQLQLLIAKEIIENKKTPMEIIAEGIFKHTTVHKVANAIASGDKPKSLDPDFIASAKPPQKFGEDKKGSQKGGVTPATMGQATSEITEAAVLKLVPKVLSLPLTPDIFISYMCAVARGFPGDVADWLSMACRDFWYGRGVNPFEDISGFTSEKVQEVIKDGNEQTAGLAK